MKIAILGSIADEKVDAEKFKSACIELGKKLSEGGHFLIVCSENESSADPHIVEGANSDSKKTTQIEVIRSEEEDNSAPFHKDEANYPNIDFTFSRCSGGWNSTHLKAIINSDLVLLVGGKASVWTAANSAKMLNKPVVALPCFNGTSRRVWEKLVNEYKETDLSESDLGYVREGWGKSSANSVISFIDAVYKRHLLNYSGKPIGLNVSLFLFSLILIIAWVSLLNKVEFVPERVSVITMVIICSVLGIILRGASLGRYVDGWRNFLSEFFADALKGVLAGFVLTLVHLFSELTINGKISDLTDESAFVRIALSISMIAALSGFALDKSLSKIAAIAEEKISGVGK